MTVAATDTYNEVENLIFWTAHEFRKEYGGDIDELIGEARVIYWELYSELGRPYIRQKEKRFAQAVRYYIRVNLLSERRKQLYRQARGKVSIIDPEVMDASPQRQSNHWLVDFLDELSEDAATIVAIVLETPGFVWRIESGREDDPKKFLWSYLRELGWTFARIDTGFEELEEALS